VNSETTPGLLALLGRVRLKIVRGDARFAVGDQHLVDVEVGERGALVGRGVEADIRLVGEDTPSVSRRHLVVRPADWQWVVFDISTKGTWEVAGDGRSWHRLTPSSAIPLTPGMDLRLGKRLVLRFELERHPTIGTTTAPGEDVAGAAAQRVHPAGLEDFARALLALRRTNPMVTAIPPVTQIAADFGVARSTVDRKLDDLRELPEVDRLEPGPRSQDLADALAVAFPYLAAPAPEGLPG
jgi:hypothetical protein